MVNTRSKTRKTQGVFKTRASVEDTNDKLTESADVIGSNDDLLTEILLRLPVTSILRFKSVSKHWLRLLSHRSFILRYDNLSKSPGIFFGKVYVPFGVENRITQPFPTLDFCNDPYGIKIVQSSNGLLLCSSDRYDKGYRRYYVYNPTTNQYAIIPMVSGGQAAQKTIFLMALAFHPTDCVDYKLVCIRKLRTNWELLQIQIYSSDTRKWKISIKFTCTKCFFILHQLYMNGAIYFTPSYGGHMYFDIASERLHTLPSVEDMQFYKSDTMYLGESRGRLHIIKTNSYEYNSSFALNVYELLSDRSGWFLKYQVELDEVSHAFPEMIKIRDTSYHRFNVIDVVRGEKEEDTFMVLTIPQKLIMYNIHDKSFKQIFNHNSMCKRYIEEYTLFHRYTETLASL